MRLAILGLGLIGGSIARALREPHAAEWTIAAWTPASHGPNAAAAAGVVDAAPASIGEAVAGADIVVLAASPLDCLELLDRLAGDLRSSLEPGVVITDVASTKRTIVDRAGAAGLPFVGGHPMAGREATGFEASDGTLFVGRPWVVCPGAAAEEHVARVEDLARAVRAAPVRMDAATHDAAVAAISHLPLVVSAALVESVFGGGDADNARRLAASGWRDVTRLARGDPVMGAGIVATNGDLVADRIRAFRGVLDDWLAELERTEPPDAAAAEARLRRARALLEDEPIKDGRGG